jgi:hypothetical protein
MAQTFRLPKGERSLARLMGFLSALGKEREWKVEVSEFKRTRSNEQNAYLWGVAYPAILKHLPGWDADDIHEYCLGECFGWETLEGLGRRRVKPVRRSSRLSTTEFSDYVGFIQRTMAAKGIDVPDPGETSEEAA